LNSLGRLLAGANVPMTVRVVARGDAIGDPDEAYIRVEAAATKPRAVEAKAAVDETITRLSSVLRELGVPNEDIDASRLNIHPSFEYKGENHVLSGYGAGRDITITLKDLDKLDVLLQKVVEAGAHRINPVIFGSSKEDDLREEAIRKATTKAKEKARILAGEFGAKVGRAISIRDEDGPGGLGTDDFGHSMADATGSSSYLRGRVGVMVTLSVVFELVYPE